MQLWGWSRKYYNSSIQSQLFFYHRQNSCVTFRKWTGLKRPLAIVWSLETLSLLYTQAHARTHSRRLNATCAQHQKMLCMWSNDSVHITFIKHIWGSKKSSNTGWGCFTWGCFQYRWNPNKSHQTFDQLFNKENWQNSSWVIKANWKYYWVSFFSVKD